VSRRIRTGDFLKVFAGALSLPGRRDSMSRRPGEPMPAPKRSAARNSKPKSNTAFRRLPLSSLRVFVAVAEQLSFTRAASALGITAGAVSMQIRSLEEYLGATLFNRSGRIVELTPEGARLLPRVRKGLEELERAIDEARSDRRTGPLMITMLASFLQQWLLPRLQAFNDRYPDIELRLHTSPQLVDFLRSEVQAAVRFGVGDWPQLHVEKVLDEWLVPVCSKTLLSKHGSIRTRDDLKRIPLLHSLSEPWNEWPDITKASESWGSGGAAFDDSVTVVRAAEAGQGFALVRWSLAYEAIRDGRLVLASPRVVKAPRSYYFVCPPSYVSMEKVAAFRDWLFEQAAAAPLPNFTSIEVARQAR
jgi:LysR family glycine cleavage system transcriptional activator